MSKKTRNIVTWILSFVVAFIFISSGLFKLFGGEKTAEMSKGVGGIENLVTLGVLELVMTLLFLIPRTGIIGSLLMIAYMGGAMAVHFVTGQSVVVVVLIEILIWITSAFRFSELTERLIQGKRNVSYEVN